MPVTLRHATPTIRITFALPRESSYIAADSRHWSRTGHIPCRTEQGDTANTAPPRGDRGQARREALTYFQRGSFLSAPFLSLPVLRCVRSCDRVCDRSWVGVSGSFAECVIFEPVPF